MQLKFAPASVAADFSLNARQIRVIANSGKVDRVGDVLVPSGRVWTAYLANPIVLAAHDSKTVVGNFAPEVTHRGVEGVITFAPGGVSPDADKYCGLYKSGVMRTVSVGFQPLDGHPNKTGGFTYDSWELCELSCVAVPADTGAVVIGRDASASRKGNAASWKCGASRNLPIGGDDAWDGPAAAASIFAKAGFEGDSPDVVFARKGFLAYDSENPKLKGSYKLPFAKVVDRRLTAMPSGIRAAASRLPQADIPEDVQTKARAVLDDYEAKMDGKAYKSGRVLSGANQHHLNEMIKCMGKAADCNVKAAALHDCLHDTLVGMQQQIEKSSSLHDHLNGTLAEMQQHIEQAGEHGKAICDDAAGDGGYDEPGNTDENADTELSFGAAHRKRVAGALSLVPEPLTPAEQEVERRSRIALAFEVAGGR